MLSFVFTFGEIAALLACLYGAWLTIRHADILGDAITSLKERAGMRSAAPREGAAAQSGRESSRASSFPGTTAESPAVVAGDFSAEHGPY